ncbi:MAG: hypothetical protein U9Q12_03335 [Patescibacteria group bacterium]|nr:hypothetical protein [Patescibacteria group bacterium]
MEVYVIDDKAEELENARIAIEAAGHECANGELSAIQMFNAGIGKEHGNRGQLAQVELLTAVERMRDCGGGIITDMMFNLIPQNGDVPPSGILVVLHALSRGVPLVVCTDAEEVGGHHAKALSWIHDAYIMPARRCGVLPFGWIETKNWKNAVKKLEDIQVKKGEGK